MFTLPTPSSPLHNPPTFSIIKHITHPTHPPEVPCSTNTPHCRLSPAEIEQKVTSLLSQMTLKEKVWLLNGNWDLLANQVKYKNAYNPRPIATNGLKRLGISPVKFSDGPRGVVMGHSTCFPVSMARGASFDRALERRIGDAIGVEARAQGANFFGGVCVNLLRHPAWGRSQETYGEDPFLVGELGASLAGAVQEHNVIACVKHYAFNSIENSRFEVNVKADERTMHEVYLPHFKKIVQAGAASVMGAYNRFMGEQACESHLLLTEILRDDWGFQGFTISDFIFGVRDGKKAIEAGLDVEMPAPIHYQRNLLRRSSPGRSPRAPSIRLSSACCAPCWSSKTPPTRWIITPGWSPARSMSPWRRKRPKNRWCCSRTRARCCPSARM